MSTSSCNKEELIQVAEDSFYLCSKRLCNQRNLQNSGHGISTTDYHFSLSGKRGHKVDDLFVYFCSKFFWNPGKYPLCLSIIALVTVVKNSHA